MKIPMLILHNKLLWLATGFVLLVNAFVLGKVYVNRTQVVAQLQLSERELRLPYNYGFTKEDSSARVSLQWATPHTEPVDPGVDEWHGYHDRRLQLSDVHFASFNFPACEKTNRIHHKQGGWVLLEFNGQSYVDYVARAERYHSLIQNLAPASNTGLSEKELANKRKGAVELLEAAKKSKSRLFAIDAAADRNLLELSMRRRQLADGATLFMVPADIQTGYNRCDKPEKRTTDIQVANLAVESLYIPNALAKGFPRDGDARQKIRFIADIYYGRLFEPWINNVKFCAKGCP
jgi:hypothetical protein